MSKPPAPSNPAPTGAEAGANAADTGTASEATRPAAAAIRAALKSKQQGNGVGQRSGRDLHEQKPPFPPRGTRRSMGKR